eukprot:31307-Pelagococcus_subviridis.AAC.6
MHHLRDLVARRLPHPEVHAAASRERRVDSREVVSGHHDRDSLAAGAVVRAPLASDAHARRVVAQVHERRGDDLVVHRGLIVAVPSDAGVQIADGHSIRANVGVEFIGVSWS